MIKVIYRWRIDPDRQSDFASWWHDGTLRIRSSRQGALGSTLCRPTGDDEHLVAVARWESQEDLVEFWKEPAGSTFEGAHLESAEIFDELDDLTVDNSRTDP